MRTILVASALVLLAPALASAQVTCGDTIGKGQTVTLTADIGPCDTSPTIPDPGLGFALTVEGGTLDLAGHTLACADTDGDGRIPYGIRLDGEKATVRNGTVIGCEEGLAVGILDGGQDTEHRAVHVTVQNSRYVGVGVRSNKNTLIDVRSTNSFGRLGYGFWILGDESKLVGLTATGNDAFGIRISGKKNTVIGATATGNARDGFWVDDESKKNNLTACQGSGNGDSGIRIEGLKNKVDDSIANDNAAYGFVLEAGSQNRIRGGSAHDNSGFDLLNCYDDKYGNKVSDLDYTTETTESSDCL
jgi:hypothetical protein